MLEPNDFQKMDLYNKINQLLLHGTYITKRHFLHFEVSLYYYNNFFVEVWKNFEFNSIYSIDLAPERSIKEAYLKSIDLKALGLEI
ncbi:MAG: hypothetical protein AB7O47_10885 [Flavobacteriales bacterium]